MRLPTRPRSSLPIRWPCTSFNQFEAVEVEEDQAEGFRFPACCFQLFLEDGVEMARVVEAGDVVGYGELLDAGYVLRVFDGDGGVVDQNVQEGDGVVGLLVEMGVEDLEDAVGSFAAADGQADCRTDNERLILGGSRDADIGGGFWNDEGLAMFGDPAGETFAYFYPSCLRIWGLRRHRLRRSRDPGAGDRP